MKPNRQETADAYPGIVAHLTDSLRVIASRDGIQWILQQRRGDSAERPWRAKSYCTTRKSLMRCCAASGAPVETLEGLPEVFPATRTTTTRQETRRKEPAA